jgi:limonene-1,2-epoxide hydrolase
VNDANAIVTAFVKEFDTAHPDADRLAAYFTEDAIYHNIPLEPVRGKAAIRKVLGGMAVGMESGGWEVAHQVADGEIVMNERVDRFKSGDKPVSIPVMGVFRVVDGKIAEWRDYFDLATWQKQMA